MSTRSKKNLFKKGERVSAHWAGSNIYYDAKIIDVTQRTYKVQFDDGSVSSVKFSEVKPLSQSNKESSPKTSKSKSRSRSGSTGRTNRSKSPGRPPRSRSRSPARKEKKSSTKEENKKSESLSTSNSVSKEETDSPIKPILTREKIGLSKQEISRSSPVILNSYSKEMSVTMEKYESTATSSDRLRSSRLAALRSSELSRDAVDSKPTSENRNARIVEKAKYSDDEEDEEEEEAVVIKTGLSKSQKAFFFIITALRIVLIPISLLFLVFACTKKQCTILDVPQFYSRWRDVFNAVKYPIAGIFGFHVVNCILSLIPLGKKVTGFSFEGNKSPIEYCLNGIFILMFHVIVFGLCSYFGLYLNWGYDKFKGFALSSAFYCIVWSIVLHIYSLFKANGTSQTKVPILGKFYNGSYTNPMLFGKLDLKTSFIRTGLMGLVLLNLSILLKFFLMKGTVSVPLALTSGMQIFFVFDLFVREEKLLSTATYTSDTFGYAFILTTAFLVPIGLTLQNVYLFNFEARSSFIPHYCSAAIVALFLFGYFIYLTSTNLKHNFRRNPFSPSLANVTSIPTSKKKRLIASGLWGQIRHPNYLGLLIMAIAWTLPCGVSHVVPYGPLIMLAIALIIRSYRIEAECKEKYGPAWDNYTGKVQSRLIPYVF